MDPEKRINFPILSKAFQNYTPLVPFKNKRPKYELNIWVGSFWARVPPPTAEKWGWGGRISAPYDLNDVNANFESF